MKTEMKPHPMKHMNPAIRSLALSGIGQGFRSTSILIALAMFGFATSAIAADVDWTTSPTANGTETYQWSDTANWSGAAIPTDGQSIHVAPSSTQPNWFFDLDVDITVSLPNSDMTFKNQKVKLVGAGSLEGRDFETDQQGGGKPEFHVPVTARDVNSTYGYFYGGLTADVFNNKGGSIISTTAATLGEFYQTGDGIMSVNVPLSIRSGKTGNTTITRGSYRASVAGGVLGGTVTVSAVTDTSGTVGAGSLVMLDHTTMPTAINLGGIGNGLVIDDDVSLVYGANVTLPENSAFRDKSSGQVSTGGGPTAAQLPGLIYWAMDETSNDNRTSNIHTLTTNSKDSDSPYKGFAFGTFSSNVGTEQKITLQMGAGETNNMQILTAWYNNNGSTFGDDTTMKHSGAVGASTTADILMVVGPAPFSGAINEKAINAGGAEATNLIDTFNLIANTPGMRLGHRTENNIVLAGQELALDNGYFHFQASDNAGNSGANMAGTLRAKEGSTIFQVGNQQLTVGTAKIILEDGSQLQIEDAAVLEGLTAAQIETPGSDATLGLDIASIDFDTDIGTVLSNLMSRVKVINSRNGTVNYTGANGLTLADGQYLGNPWGSLSTIGSSSKITATAGKDLHLAGFGTQTLNIEGNLNAGANKIVIGTDPGVELYSNSKVEGSGNDSGVSYHVQKMRPTGYVEFDNNTTFNAPPSVDVKSGQLRLRTAAFSFANLDIGDGGLVDFLSGSGLTIAGTLSGIGTAQAAANLTFNTVAPGLTNGCGNLTWSTANTFKMAAGATYEWGMAATNTAGVTYDLITVAGAATFDTAWTLKIVDGGFRDILTGAEIFTIIAGTSAPVGFVAPSSITAPGTGFNTDGASVYQEGNDVKLTGVTGTGLPPPKGTIFIIN